MANFNENISAKTIAKYLRESTCEYSDKQMEDMLTIAQNDVARTRELSGREIRQSTLNLHNSYHRALLVFAGICITPFTAMLTGSAIPSDIGLGLGLGVVGCVGYTAYHTYEYLQTEKQCSEKIAEKEATATAVDILLSERMGQKVQQR